MPIFKPVRKSTYGRFSKAKAVVVLIVVFGAVGTFLLANSHASTPTTYFEAESGTPSANVVSLNDSTASGSHAIEFTAGSGGGTGTGGTQTTNCLPTKAQLAASINTTSHLCGFPDTTNTGVPAGTTMTTVNGSVTVSTNGAILQNEIINGGLNINANNVTVKNVEVNDAAPASFAVIVRGTGFTMENSTIHGVGNDSQSAEYAITNDGSTDMVVKNTYMYNCTECFVGPGTLEDSYILINVTYAPSHYENTYFAGGSGNYQTLNHNTFVNAEDNAVVYSAPDSGAINNFTITNNLLAGGGYVIYGGNQSGSTSTNVTVTGNHFSRIYYPNSGSFGVAAYLPTTVTWSGNVWDDTGAAVSKP